MFARLDRFWSFFGATVFLVVTIGLAFLTIIGGLLLATIWLYVFPLMLDRHLGFWEALRESKEIVMAAGFWQHFVLVVILAVIASVANGLLAIVAAPFMIALVAAAYFEATNRVGAASVLSSAS